MSHPRPVTLYRIAAAAGCGSAIVLLMVNRRSPRPAANAAKRAELSTRQFEGGARV